jgi:FMN phosphatase YigB (HAD superfamily)
MVFAGSIPDWPIFPDSSSALARLAKHFKLVVLSNIDNDSLGWTHQLLSLGSATQDAEPLYSYPVPNPNKFWHPQETSGSKSPFTAIFTAEDVGCYKPSRKGFRTALDYIQSQLELFGIADDESSQDEIKAKVLCVAQSLKHDIEPGNELGLHSVWIDRQSAVTCNEAGEGKPGWGKWTWRFETLGAMAEAVEKEV